LLLRLLATPPWNTARRPQRRIGENIADLRMRGWRKRSLRGGDKDRNASQDNGSKHLARL
jgi:hypothetical protein